MTDDVKMLYGFLAAVCLVTMTLIFCTHFFNAQTTLKALEAGYSQRPTMKPGEVIWTKEPCTPVSIR